MIVQYRLKEEVVELISDFQKGKVFFDEENFLVVTYCGKYGFSYEVRDKKTLRIKESHSKLYVQFFVPNIMKKLKIGEYINE